MTYELYQLDRGSKNARQRFMPYDWMRAHGYSIDPKNYECVYTGELDGTNLIAELEALFRKFNADLDKPLNYSGRSMAVSDVVVVRGQGKPRAFYCDCVGFKEIEWEVKTNNDPEREG